MAIMDLNLLQEVARDVIGKPSIVLRDDAKAQDVVGWDSLNHTLIVLDLNTRLAVDISPHDAAKAANFGEMVRMFQSAEGGLTD